MSCSVVSCHEDSLIIQTCHVISALLLISHHHFIRFELYYNRGWAHSRAGNNQKAIQDYTKSLQLQPKLTKANMSRAKVCDVA